MISLVLGALVGSLMPAAAPFVSWMGLAFKLSLQMIVMPIVITSILCGMESIGDIRLLEGLGKRVLGYFSFTTLIAITVGLLLVTTIKPGIRPPSDDITQMVNQIDASSYEEIGDKICINLSDMDQFNRRADLLDSMKSHIKFLSLNANNSDDLKAQTLEYLGSVQLRSKLLSDARVTTVSFPSLQSFFENQLRNALVNPFEALAKQQVLAAIIFTILLGGAMTTIGPLGQRFFEFNRAINLAISTIINLIMRFAPFGIFGLLVSVISATGPEVFRELFKYALTVVAGLSFHLFIFLPLLNYFFTRQSPLDFLKKLKPALLVAFSTSSSNASLPIAMQTMDDVFLVDKRVSRFVLPLGATVNMNGTALYEAVAAVFIAQLYGVNLGFSSQVIIALTAAFAAIGTAGIPAAGTVTMALVLSAVGLPMEGVGLLFALDRPLDMCRTAVNVAGDAAGCSILSSYFKKRNQEA